jgi:hypothetical protein
MGAASRISHEPMTPQLRRGSLGTTSAKWNKNLQALHTKDEVNAGFYLQRFEFVENNPKISTVLARQQRVRCMHYREILKVWLCICYPAYPRIVYFEHRVMLSENPICCKPFQDVVRSLSHAAETIVQSRSERGKLQGAGSSRIGSSCSAVKS